jgi:hypothetical protein
VANMSGPHIFETPKYSRSQSQFTGIVSSSARVCEY